MKHIDLFSGIGGFALAVDRVWPNAEHVFCEIDPFCNEILKKHWPKAPIVSDIKQFTFDTRSNEHRPFTKKIYAKKKIQEIGREALDARQFIGADLLTGGFPCQPFSQAGQRRGTADDRQVHADLESEGYEVQAFIIPACALNAPHRRDRVWIVANRRQQYGEARRNEAMEKDTFKRSSRVVDAERCGKDAPDSPFFNEERGERKGNGRGRPKRSHRNASWNADWLKVAARLCRMDDGIPKRMDRNSRLKALGNAIVPQVAEEIMRGIKKINL